LDGARRQRGEALEDAPAGVALEIEGAHGRARGERFGDGREDGAFIQPLACGGRGGMRRDQARPHEHDGPDEDRRDRDLPREQEEQQRDPGQDIHHREQQAIERPAKPRVEAREVDRKPCVEPQIANVAGDELDTVVAAEPLGCGLASSPTTRWPSASRRSVSRPLPVPISSSVRPAGTCERAANK
jgi:hypothetical protein